MHNTILFICKAIDGVINSNAMATVDSESKLFQLDALRSGEFYCIVVRMCDSKGTYLGTLVKTSII